MGTRSIGPHDTRPYEIAAVIEPRNDIEQQNEGSNAVRRRTITAGRFARNDDPRDVDEIRASDQRQIA